MKWQELETQPFQTFSASAPGTNDQTLLKGAAVLNDYNGLIHSLLRDNHYPALNGNS